MTNDTLTQFDRMFTAKSDGEWMVSAKKAIVHIVQMAVMTEREACADIAHAIAHTSSIAWDEVETACAKIEAAIRSRPP